jgi:hypothetical protein
MLIAGCGGGSSTATSTSTVPATSGTTATTAAPPVANPALGQAVLSWNPPLQNTDGSMLTDLTGFNIYYGKDPNNPTYMLQLDWNQTVRHVIYDLDPGTWYFTVRAYNSAGVESDYSPTVSKTIS